MDNEDVPQNYSAEGSLQNSYPSSRRNTRRADTGGGRDSLIGQSFIQPGSFGNPFTNFDIEG